MPYAPALPERPGSSEVREALLGAGHYLVELRQRPIEERGNGFEEDVRSAVAFIHDWDPILVAFERGENPSPTNNGGVPSAAMDVLQLRNRGDETGGVLLIRDSGFRDFARGRQSDSTNYSFRFDGSLFAQNEAYRYMEGEQRTLITGLTTGTASGGVLAPVGQPTDLPIRTQQRRMFLRDLCTVLPTSLPVVPYIREVNAAALEGSASAVAEGSAKPEVEMDWDPDNAIIKKVAAWVPVTTEIIEDAPLLRGYIDTRLAYMLAVREEAQLISGDGTGANVKGILSFTVQTQASVTDVPQTLAASIGKIENADGEADGIVMNPVKYWSAIASRYSTQFDGGFFGNGAPFSGPSNTMWGLPVVRTRALATTKALVGSFRLALTVLDRMRTTIVVGNQHASFLVENKVAIVAEERVGLAVHRPDWIVDTTLP